MDKVRLYSVPTSSFSSNVEMLIANFKESQKTIFVVEMASIVTDLGSPVPGKRESVRLKAKRVEQDTLTESPTTRSQLRRARELPSPTALSPTVPSPLTPSPAVPTLGTAPQNVVGNASKKRRRTARTKSRSRTVHDSESHIELRNVPSTDDDSDFYKAPAKKGRLNGLLARRGHASKGLMLRVHGKNSPKNTSENTNKVAKATVNLDWLGGLKTLWPTIVRMAAADGGGDLNGTWLVAAGSVCRDFADATAKTLYSNPQIKSDKKLKRLLETLSQPAGSTMFDYRKMVFSLHFGPKYLPRDSLVISLVERLPRLAHMSISIAQDNPPYGELVSRVRKPYPKIWLALSKRFDNKKDVYGRKLISWKWSWNIAEAGGRNNSMTLDDIIQLHTVGGPLEDLQKLHMVGFFGTDNLLFKTAADNSVEAIAADESATKTLTKCATIVTSLQHLTTLKLEACSVVDGRFMSLLPHVLERLNITYCWNLTTENLDQFLRAGGRKLKSLTLCHNQGVHLSFLTGLGSSCPNLEDLHVNMNLYRSVLDGANELDFQDALLEGQTPAWPTSLHSIELLHVRPFTHGAARELLHSLMAKSKDLGMLRHLIIKAYVNLGWRERADMRRHWLTLLEKVFLRPKGPDPKPYRSLPKPITALKPATPSPGTPATPVRRSRRVLAQHDSDPSSPASTSSMHRAYMAIDDEDRFFENDICDPKSTLPDAPRYHVQGECEHVELTIGDGKPTSLQFGMDDFLDRSSPGSEDEDPDYGSRGSSTS